MGFNSALKGLMLTHVRYLSDNLCHSSLEEFCVVTGSAVLTAVPVCRKLACMNFSSGYCSQYYAYTANIYKESV